MIDLSGAKVGDEYTTEDGQSCVIVIRKENDICFELLDGADLLFITNPYGVPCVANYHHLRIRAKNDPRHWLKDLPDADLFHNDLTWVECHWKNKGNFWFASCKGIEAEYWVPLKMPTITEEECEQSKISIAKLREWQEANKGNTHRKLEQFKDY